MATPVTVNTKSSINVVGGGTGTANFLTGSNEYAIVSYTGNQLEVGSVLFGTSGTYYVPPSTSVSMLTGTGSWVIFANT
jgi:hypothetical protein